MYHNSSNDSSLDLVSTLAFLVILEGLLETILTYTDDQCDFAGSK